MWEYWKDKQVLVTGGMGFIGSNLAISLVSAGAQVTIVDAMIDFLGGNDYNIKSIKDCPNLRVNISNVCDRESIEHLVKGKDYIFHLASQVSHVLGQTDPFPDIQYNIFGTATLLEACKKHNPQVKILYTGTRGQYGPSMHNPISEEASLAPLGMHEITKVAVEQMLLDYHRRHNIRSVLTRLTNVYGPRAQMKSDKYCVVNWFVRQAIDGGTIKLYGGGKYKRDFLFIHDCVDDLLKLAEKDCMCGEIFNVGNDEVNSFEDVALCIIRNSGSGSIEKTEFTSERKINEPGDIYLDISKIKKMIDLRKRTSLEDGIVATIDFYKDNKRFYW